MRQNPNSRRSRGRGSRKPGNSRNQIFDSNGPGARVRGNSAQIYEKYQQLARDATSSGDRVGAENFYQHAEHYFRLMEAAGLNRTAQEGNPQKTDNPASNGGMAPNGEAAPSDNAAPNGETAPDVEIAEVAAQVEVAEVAPQPVSEHAPESVAALIEAVEQGNTGQREQASPEAGNGGDDSEQSAKPARRTRSRRPNGSANGQKAPVKNADKDADTAASDEDSETPKEDPNPVSA